MEITPTSQTAVHAFLTISHGTALSRISEPLDCSTPILDLCIRRKPRAFSPEIKAQHSVPLKSELIYTETPTSTVGISSPDSRADSETSETSASSDLYRDLQIRSMQQSLVPKVKIPRPFKAYPKNPLSLAAAECVLSKESAEAYSEFRKQMLAQVQASHGIINKNMRRTSQGSNLHNLEDACYWEKRRKNNEAAKRSRDARRAKEDELAIRAAFLERENLHLRCEVANMRMELEELRSVVYRRPVV